MLPHPIAAAWHGVALATSDADRIQRLLAVVDVVPRFLVSLVIADYLRGPRSETIDGLLPQLRRPSLGHWVALLRHIVRHVDADALFVPEIRQWHVAGRGKKPTAAAKLLDRLVETRNEIAHRSGPMGPSRAEERAEELLAQVEELLASLEFLSELSLVRVLSVEPGADALHGRLQIFAGHDPQPAPVDATWTDTGLVRGVLYLQRGDAFLDLTPWVAVRPDPTSGEERLFVVREAPKREELRLSHDPSGAVVHLVVDWDSPGAVTRCVVHIGAVEPAAISAAVNPPAWIGLAAAAIVLFVTGMVTTAIVGDRTSKTSLPDDVGLTVLLFHDPAVPPVDDIAARRRYLGETLLPALIAKRPRAILIDLTFGPDPAMAAELVPVQAALDAAADADIPVMAVQPMGGPSALPRCDDAGTGCVADLVRAHLPEVAFTDPAPAVSRWPTCQDLRPTLGFAAARLLVKDWRSVGDWLANSWCDLEPVDIALPSDDPCARPYETVWADEVVSGIDYTGPDPVALQPAATCPTSDLSDRVVIIGEPRFSDVYGQDALDLHDSRTGRTMTLSGAEAHAVLAWNFLGVL